MKVTFSLREYESNRLDVDEKICLKIEIDFICIVLYFYRRQLCRGKQKDDANSIIHVCELAPLIICSEFIESFVYCLVEMCVNPYT